MSRQPAAVADDGRYRTVCRMCHGGCGAIVEVRDGEVARVEGDPDNPNNFGFLCAKGRASVEHLRHPDRLRRPLRRVGPRGSGAFTEIGWGEALDTVAEHLADARDRGAPESVVFAQGTDRNYQEWLFRFANCFGSPNVLGPAHVCFYPRVMAGIMSMGAFTFSDYEGGPDCVLLWGSNKAVTHADGVIGVRLLRALDRGARLIVVDPRRIGLVSKASHWLPVRPGADAALALAMLHVVIAEEAWDASFVERHTGGFDALARHVRAYAPERVAAETGVEAAVIREAALAYARAPAATIELGTGAQQHRGSFHTARALAILSAVCGNIDRPGGDVVWEPSGIVGRRSLPASDQLGEERSRKRLGGERHRLLSMAGWAHPGSVWTAVLEQRPYPVSSLLVFGSNLLVNYADSERVHAALRRVGFLAVADLFLTPTARMADVVLPAAGWLERDQIVEHAHYVAARRKLAQVGEARSDEEMLNDLARRLGMAERFWATADEALDARLAPIGSNWAELAERAYLANSLTYFKYRRDGFATRDGRFNLYSEGLRRMGYEPLPVHLPAPAPTDDLPYVLTSAHSPFYFNSEFRNVGSLRSKEPDPLAELPPDVASNEGIADGDWVEVSTGTAARAILARARVTPRVRPGVVSVAATWWYPERGDAGSWRLSNANMLTSNADENEEMGSSNLRGLPCRVRRTSRRPAEEAADAQG